MKRPHTAAIGNVLESMDVCNPTRSHEQHPSMRLRERARTRRLRKAVAFSLCALAVLALIVLVRASST